MNRPNGWPTGGQLRCGHEREVRGEHCRYSLQCTSTQNELDGDNYAAERQLENDLFFCAERVRERVRGEMEKLRRDKTSGDVALAMWLQHRSVFRLCRQIHICIVRFAQTGALRVTTWRRPATTTS